MCEEKEDAPPEAGGAQGESKQETRFPQSIEGTRGPKDSARRAREWYQEQRESNQPNDPNTQQDDTETTEKEK